uniref:Uncharacterized protein n=1 Tax=Branchiostoma floridae TaxID=7739 RepID=C3ZD42_BRAFL|eukprot:XP_002593542.1 hypothetical protein BRAFLDRAFT_88523 [Branchiostoma floridae]
MASAGNPNYPGGGGAQRPGFNMFPAQQMTQQGMMVPPTSQGMMGVGPMSQGMMGVPQGMMGPAAPGQMAAPVQGVPQGFRGSPVPGIAPQFGGMPQQYGIPVSGGFAYSPEMQKTYAEQQKKFAEQQQKMAEEQKKREEKERKERQFQEQKRRLGAMRTTTMGKGGANFDSMFGRAVQGFALDVTKGSTTPKAQGPNLQSMMLESCDLTGPDKPKKAFQKTAPPRMPTINKTATPSQKARDWNSSTFSGVFTVETPQNGTGPLTLEFLHTLQQPPVPKLDQNLLVPPKGRSSSFGPHGMLGGPPTVPISQGTVGTVAPVSQSALGKTDQLQGMMGGEDDFADFQEAPRPLSGSTDTSSDYPDKYGAIRAYMGSDSQDSTSISSHGSGFYTGLGAHSTGGVTEGDDFADFKSASSEPTPPPAPVPAFLKSLTTHHNKALPDLAGFEDENITAAPPTSASKPPVSTAPLSSDIFNIRKKSFDDFADFKSADSNVWEKQDGGNTDEFGEFASTADLKTSSSEQKLTESLSGFADFVQSGKSAPAGEGDFAEFQQSSDLMGGEDKALDKYAVFKDISEDTQSLTSIGSTDASKDSDKYGIFRELGSSECQPQEEMFGSLSESKKTGGSEKDTQSVQSLELPGLSTATTEPASKDEEFGDFSSMSVAQPPNPGKETGLFNNQSTKATGEFGAFAALGNTAAPPTDSNKYDRQGTESKDEFGDFSWSSPTKQSPFGDFKEPTMSTGGDVSGFVSFSTNQTFGGFTDPVQSNPVVFGQHSNISQPESKLPDWSMGISQSGGSETSLPMSLFGSIQTSTKPVQIRDLTDLSDLGSANKAVPQEDEFGDFNSAAEKTGGGHDEFGDFSTAESGPGTGVGSKEAGKYAGAVLYMVFPPKLWLTALLCTSGTAVADSSPLYIRDRYSGMSSTVEGQVLRHVQYCGGELNTYSTVGETCILHVYTIGDNRVHASTSYTRRAHV